MDRLRGGLLASAATAALAIGGFADPGICSIDGGGEGGGGGGAGAAALLEDDDAGAAGGEGAGSGEGSGDGSGEGAGSGEGSGDGSGEAGAVAEWMKAFSAEAPEAGELSNQAWLAKTGVKDPDALVKRARDTEKAFRESGKIKIPGEDAKPEEIKAFREALGVPETPEGYELKLPDGLDGEKYEVDGKFLDPLRAVALENNITKAGFEAMGAAFMKKQAEDMANQVAANNQARDAKVKEWGKDATARKEEFRRGVSVLGLDGTAIAKIQDGFGVGETMDLLAKIGHMAGEDFFANGATAQRFGVADADAAKKAIDAMINDPATAKALREKSNPELVAKYNRLTEALAKFREIESKK